MKNIKLKQILSVCFFLTLINALFFHKIISGASWLWEDFTNFHFPIKYYILNILKDGAFSFWNPYIFSGAPTAADIQIGLFYPLNLLLVPFSKADIGYMYWLLEIQVIFHLFLGGLFMYLLMRYLKVSHFSSLFSAMIFSLSSFFIVHLKHVNMIEDAVWMPLIFLFFHKAIHNNSPKDLIYSSFFMGISILAGHPQINYLIFLFAFAYLAYCLITEKSVSLIPFSIGKTAAKKIFFFLIFAALSFGIAAVEIIPYLEIFNFSNINASGSFAFASSFSLHPVQFIITSFLPHFFGGQNDIVGYAGEWNYWELANYLGIIPLFLAIIGFIFLKKQNFIKFLIIFSLISLTMAFGYYFFTYHIAYFLAPGMQFFRAPARFLFLYIFSAVIIAGFALDFIINKNNFEQIKLFLSDRRKKIKIFLCGIAFFLLIAALSAFFIPRNSSGMTLENINQTLFISNIFKNLIFFLLLCFGIFFIIKNYFQRPLSRKNFKIAIILLAIIDIFWFGFEFNNGRYNPKDIFQKTQEMEYLGKNNPYKFRIINQSAMPQNAPLLYSIRSINGYAGPAESRRYKDFIGEGGFNRTFSSYPKLTSSPHRLELLNACYILSDKIPPYQNEKYKKIDNLNLYQNYNCFNQTFIAHRAIIENNPETILSLIDKGDFNPLQEIILEKDLKIELPNNDNMIYNDRAEITRYEPDYIEIKTDSKENGILFLSEVYYPGWEAYVDGTKTEIYQANYIFRSIALPKGEHIVKFAYNPKIFKLGLFISLAALVSTFIALLYLSLRERQKITPTITPTK